MGAQMSEELRVLRLYRAKRTSSLVLTAVAISALYAAAFNAISHTYGDGWEPVVGMTLLLTSAWEVVIVLWRNGIRPPLILAGGPLGLILTALSIGCLLMLPLLALLAVMSLAQWLPTVFPLIPNWIYLLVFLFLPVFQLLYAAVEFALATFSRPATAATGVSGIASEGDVISSQAGQNAENREERN